MTLTLELPPELEARMKTNAAVHGKDVVDYLRSLVENDPPIDMTHFEDMADFEASVAELQQGFADADAGRTFSFEEVFARERAEREERRRRREASPDVGSQAEAAP